ncbi:MAG: glycosyltransferase family 1 protein [Candidatus Aureabacteria bacterium]|nr:glycosyltransferase family 1 protein [Candidatus Auribacterota bacterium]
MRVALDIQSACGCRTGVGQYTMQLLKHLPRVAPDDQFLGFYFGRRDEGLEEPRTPNATVRHFGYLPRRGMSLLWRTLGWPPAELFTGPVDLVHFPSFIARPLRSARAVVTVHDLAFRRIPGLCEPKNVAYLSTHLRRTLDRAACVIADSAFTAAELKEFYGYDRARVVHLGVDEVFRPRRDAELSPFRARYGLPQKYILSVGTVEPRKNYGALLRAYADVRTGIRDCPPLVIAGPDGWRGEGERVDRLIHKLGLGGSVIRLKYFQWEYLSLIYAGACLFVFPSLYEGFGLPPLEAMACGVPVVCSDAPSLPEVVGDAALQISLRDSAVLAHAIGRLLNDAVLREECVRKGLARAARFTWLDTARKTAAAYGDTLCN